LGAVRDFLDKHYRHFNARETVSAARAYEEHLAAGGKMLVSLAGAMSTGELGIILSRMIREGKVHAISCTGANLEEDVFNLVANQEYEIVDSWRALSAQDEADLYARGMNRVTDTCIPETVMRHLERRLVERWQGAAASGERRTPAEFLFQVLDDPTLEEHYQIDPVESWMLAAKEMGVPVFAPGWEDSTTGNIFAANVMMGNLPDHACVKSGTEQFQALVEWYMENHGIQDLKTEVPFWGYYCQITDAQASYGGYSGAPANEKITWGKLEAATPRFNINSDASIVAPLIFGYLLGD